MGLPELPRELELRILATRRFDAALKIQTAWRRTMAQALGVVLRFIKSTVKDQEYIYHRRR